MRTAPWMPSTEPIGRATYSRSVPSVSDERVPLTSAPCNARSISGRLEKSRPTGLPDSESAMLRPSASTMTTRPPAVSRYRAASSWSARVGSTDAPSASGSRARVASENASCWRSLVSRRSTEFEYETPSGIALTSSRRFTVRLRSSVGERAQAEPDAAHGLDPPGIAELLAQRRDVHVECLRRAVPVRVPHVLEQLLARSHRTGVVGEEREQVELLRRQRDRVVVDGDATRAAVDGEGPDLDHRDRVIRAVPVAMPVPVPV